MVKFQDGSVVLSLRPNDFVRDASGALKFAHEIALGEVAYQVPIRESYTVGFRVR